MSEAKKALNVAKVSFTLHELSASTGIGIRRLREEILTGRLRAKRFAGKLVILADEVTRFLDALPKVEPKRS